jgi:hypothetical protein
VQGIGTALEKRRLEDDEAGSITETRSGDPHHGGLNLEEEFRKRYEMAEMHLWEQERQEQERLEQQRRHQGLEEE